MNLRIRLATLMLGLLAATPAVRADESKTDRDARMAWWRDARFGMFIHWGLYSVPAGVYDGKKIGGLGEWIMHDGKIPVASYAKVAADFNPTQFDADVWANVAKNAGMKYLVVTAKHHDGFAMFHSKVDGFNIFDATPFKRDPVAELAAACNKAGIKFGVYYSQCQDWHHPGGAAFGGHWDKAQDGDYDDYLKNVSVPQVKELLTNYGPISVVWYDTDKDMTPARADPFVEAMKLQPALIFNNRLGGGVTGDTETPEQHIPANGFKGRDWETCMTINNTWGFKSTDTNFKSAKSLLRNLIDIASKGGNYLLNVGPDSTGVIPEAEVNRLAEMGAWLKANGESIYGTTAGPFTKTLPFGRATAKPGKLFLNVFDRPADGMLHVPMTSKIARAYLLKSPADSLAVKPSDDGMVIAVGPTPPDAISSVIVLDLGEPVTAAPPVPIRAAADGRIHLDAADGQIDGSAQLETKHGNVPAIGFWTDLHDAVRWSFDATPAGRFKVELSYADAPGFEGSEYVVTIGDQTLTGTVTATDSWDDFKPVELGTITLASVGKVELTIKGTKMPHGAVMNLKSVVLTPQQ